MTRQAKISLPDIEFSNELFYDIDWDDAEASHGFSKLDDETSGIGMASGTSTPSISESRG